MFKIKNSKGFSLTSVLIATALAGGLGLLVMRLTENMNKTQKSGIASMDTVDLINETRIILNDQKNCKVSLAGVDPTNPVKFKKMEIDDPANDAGLPFEIFLSDTTGTTRRTKKFSADPDIPESQYGRLKINNIRLFMNNGTGFNYGIPDTNDLGIVRVNYSFQAKTYFKDYLTRVNFTTDNTGESTITNCTLMGSSSTNFEEICKKFPGHEWISGECRSPNQFDKMISFKIRFYDNNWAVVSSKILFTKEIEDKTIPVVISNSTKVNNGFFKLRVQHNGSFMDSSEILSGELINEEISNPFKLSISDNDGNNVIEIIKSDDSSQNAFVNNDVVHLIFASPRD